MIRAILAFHLALLTSGTGFALEGAVCPDMERPFPAPANEVVEVIAEWFGNRGYHILKVHPRPGVAHLRAWNARDDWEITVRPRSALAALATVVHTNAADIGPTCRHLREYVDGYLLGTASGLPAIGANRPGRYPRRFWITWKRRFAFGRDPKREASNVPDSSSIRRVWYCARPTI